MFESESTVRLQNPKSKSLRTTIPVDVVKILNLEDKDKIKWIVDVENNKMIISIEKLK